MSLDSAAQRGGGLVLWFQGSKSRPHTECLLAKTAETTKKIGERLRDKARGQPASVFYEPGEIKFPFSPCKTKGQAVQS